MAVKTTLTMKPMVVLVLWALVMVLGYLGISAIDRHRSESQDASTKKVAVLQVNEFALKRVVVTCYEGFTLVNVGVHGFFYKLTPDGKLVPCKE